RTLLLLSCTVTSLFTFFLILIRRHPTSTLFPYTTLFRSSPALRHGARRHLRNAGRRDGLYQRRRVERSRGEAEKRAARRAITGRSEEHTSELQSPCNLVCRLLLEKKKKTEQTLNNKTRGA